MKNFWIKKEKGFNQLNNFIKDKINAKRYLTGFTIIEIIIAISVLSFGFLLVYNVFFNNGILTYNISPTQLAAEVLASNLSTGIESNKVKFTVNNPAPTTTSISPASAIVSGSDFTLTVNGTGFISTSVIKFNNSDKKTTYVSPTQLTAIIAASDITTVGIFNVAVVNPTPGGGTSNSQTFTVNNPIPITTDISPVSKTAGSPQFILTVIGINFVSGSVVKFNNSNKTTTYISPTQLTTIITASDLATARIFDITVFNPAPGGGISNKQKFAIATNQGKLIIVKNTKDGDGTFGYDISPILSTLNITTVNNIGSSDPISVNSGTTYAITETIPSGWTFNSATCDKAFTAGVNSVTDVAVQTGQTTTCTFNNTKLSVVDIGSQRFTGETGININNITEVITNIVNKIIEIPGVSIIAKEIKKIIEIPKVAIVIKEIKKIIETPVGSVVTKVVSTTGVAITTATIATNVFTSSVFSPEIFLIPFRIFSLLMFALGIKKRSRPWGVVYDSITKQPIDPAYVILKDLQDKNVSSAITDIDGRYGFLVKPGVYKITANKTNYSFPSQKLLGKTQDELYDNLYFGDQIEFKKEGEVITKNIPLDSIKFDWNEFAKKDKTFMKFYSKWDLILGKISDAFFVVGFIVAVIAFFAAPYPYNTIIVGFYLFLLVLRILGIKLKPIGHIINKETGTPLSFAILRVIIPVSNIEVTHKIADKYGKYYCLIPSGKYYVKIENKNDDGSYSLVYTSPVIDTSKKGIIKKIFKV